MDAAAPTKRRNGFQVIEPLQYTVWIVIAISITLFFSLVIPFLPRDLDEWLAVALYLFFFVVGLGSFLRVSLSDPVDNGDHKAPESEEAARMWRHCRICDIDQAPDTKHCNICNKCVYKFDHHCPYLGTCIGGKNYYSFFILVFCLTSLLVVQLSYTGLIIVHHQDNNYKHLIVTSPLTGRQVYLPLLVVTALIPFIGFWLISSLLAFHVYIGILRVSTYQWILHRRKVNDEKQKRKEEKLAKAKAKQDEYIVAKLEQAQNNPAGARNFVQSPIPKNPTPPPQTSIHRTHSTSLSVSVIDVTEGAVKTDAQLDPIQIVA
jgi:cytochrome b subunit of formate dehydrogenase